MCDISYFNSRSRRAGTFRFKVKIGTVPVAMCPIHTYINFKTYISSHKVRPICHFQRLPKNKRPARWFVSWWCENLFRALSRQQINKHSVCLVLSLRYIFAISQDLAYISVDCLQNSFVACHFRCFVHDAFSKRPHIHRAGCVVEHRALGTSRLRQRTSTRPGNWCFSQWRSANNFAVHHLCLDCSLWWIPCHDGSGEYAGDGRLAAR